jgi:hypothetical protein
MANVNHSALSDPYLHEPKGAAAASSGDVYVANGSGSGTWEDHRRSVLVVHFADISTSENLYVPIPFAGTVSRITSVIEGAISGSDVVFTVKNSSAATMGTITVTQSGSAAGDVDFLNPSSNNTVTANDYVLIQCNGGASSHTDCIVAVVVENT